MRRKMCYLFQNHSCVETQLPRASFDIWKEKLRFQELNKFLRQDPNSKSFRLLEASQFRVHIM